MLVCMDKESDEKHFVDPTATNFNPFWFPVVGGGLGEQCFDEVLGDICGAARVGIIAMMKMRVINVEG